MSRIFLIGYMGVGKSTFGEQLANKLNYTFLDLDKLIECDREQTVSQIFDEKGETFFRALENNTLSKVIKSDNVVVACGGGTPCHFDNIDLMNNSGITIYLKTSVDDLISRLSNDKEQRPLIKGKSDQEIKEFITKQLELREDFYNKARFIVKAQDLKVNELVDELQRFQKQTFGV